jgi:hypothetical protein
VLITTQARGGEKGIEVSFTAAEVRMWVGVRKSAFKEIGISYRKWENG